MIECASETAMPGSPCSSANAWASSLPCPTTRALCVSTQSTSGARLAIDASRSNDPRIRSNGCGIPTSPPCSRTAAIVSTADSPGGIAFSRKTQIRSPSRGLDLFPDDHRQPGRRELPSLERDVDPVVIRDRQMRQPAIMRSLDDVLGRRQRIEAPPMWQCRSMNARVTSGASARRVPGSPPCRDGPAMPSDAARQTCWTSDFLKKSKCSRARPVPRATQLRGFSAT